MLRRKASKQRRSVAARSYPDTRDDIAAAAIQKHNRYEQQQDIPGSHAQSGAEALFLLCNTAANPATEKCGYKMQDVTNH